MIMRERARRIGAELEIEESRPSTRGHAVTVGVRRLRETLTG